MFGRRVGPRIDRRVARLAVGVVVVVFVPLLALTHAPEPAAARTDVRAAYAFVALLARGERRDVRIDSTFTRTQPSGRSLNTTQTELRWGRVHVITGGGSAEIDLPTKTYVCAALDRGASCETQAPATPASVAQVMALAIGSRAYDIARASGETIAGERAACFDIIRQHGAPAVSELGDETFMCLAADGFVLRVRVRTALGVDDERATRVQRQVDEATMRSVLNGFEQAPEPLHR